MKKSMMQVFTKLMSVLMINVLIISLFSIRSYAQDENTDPLIMVSLGDSYSSGEGIEPFYGQEKVLDEKVKDENWLAHRSMYSWPSLLSVPGMIGTMKDYNMDYIRKSTDCEWYFRASSGATTGNINGVTTDEYEGMQKKTIRQDGINNHWKFDAFLPKQLDIFNEINGNVDYVTLTIGGNDVGFENIIANCVVGSTYLNFSFLDGVFNKLWKDFDDTKAKIKQVYIDIQKAAGSQAEIIVAGYPKLLDKNGKGVLISEEEAITVNNNVSKFNDELNKIVMECSLMSSPQMNIHFVDVEEEFDKDGGHQAYSSDPWINEIIFGAKNEDLDDMGFVSSYSIHPNASGAEAYARCVNAKIEEIENAKATLEFNGHYYKFYNSSLTWAAAKKNCEDQGGHLAVITSAEENDAISQFLAKHGSKNCYWIGVYSDGIEQDWKSVTGEAVEYTNWSSGEPNNQEGQEMYVHIYGKQDLSNSDNGIGEWNDASVNGASYAGDFYSLDNFGFICEWDNETETVFEAGDGSEENPYQISNAEQLNAVRNDLTAHYIQVADIDMSGYEWLPIGTGSGGGSYLPGIGTPSIENNPFEGKYNGNNYKITNLSITENELNTVGLFGLCTEDSKIENITIENLSISVDKSSTDYVEQWNNGVINAVSVGGIAGRCESIISNCKVSGNIEVINCNDAYVGGITGNGRVLDSVNYADIYVLSNRDSRYMNDGDVQCGGITGHPGTVFGSVERCTNYGNIDAISGDFMYCGGISGEYGAIEKCINYGVVNGSTSDCHGSSSFAGNCNVGGIVGATSGQTSNSVNYGKINGDAALGASCYAGGVAGYNGYYGDGIIENCFNVGDSITATKLIEQDGIIVSADGEAGRIAGCSQSTKNCYSVDLTLVNGVIPTTNIEADNVNGASLSKEEIDSMVNQLFSSN